ncbi:MAG: ATP-binding protein, partial [Polyangiales bacterium]
LLSVMDTGEPVRDLEMTTEVPSAPGKARHWSVSWFPVNAPDGVAMGVVAMVTDVTARKESDDKLALLLEASRVLGSSIDYQTTLANLARVIVPRLADWCCIDIGKHGEEPASVACSHVDPKKVDLVRELRAKFPPSEHPGGLLAVMTTGKASIIPEVDDAFLQRTSPDPECRRMLCELGVGSAAIVPLVARGRTLGVLSLNSARPELLYSDADLPLFEELAARAALAIDNARLHRDAQEANKTKDEFLGTVSHELRTPLTAILGWAHILRKKKRDEESIGRGLDIIERNAKAQAQIIEDILDVSRIISGKLRIEMAPTDLSASVRAALDVVRPMADTREIKLEADLADGSVNMLGDADRVQQVVWNLLSNAIKFTPKGGVVRIALERDGEVARLRVIDTGKGIEPEFLPLVFERFRQADSSASRSQGGLGLGLSIVRHITELHGGTVRAESDGKGKGATFVVEVPILAQRLSEPGAPDASERVSITPTRLDGLKVLVVDDEPDARELIAVILSEQGALCTVVASAAEALEAIKRERPDVLVSDIGMPEQDGYALIKKVRAS